MSDLNIALILRLVDQVTAPSRAVIGAVREIGAATEQAGQTGMTWADRQLEATAARRAALQGEAFAIGATGFALYQAMRPAIEFEQAMSGVARVVEFDRPESFQLLERDILNLTTSGALPMAAEGISAIIEAAGQAGVIDAALPDDERRAALIAFAEDAARMGTAFDMSAEAAGAAMTLWRVTLGMTRPEAMGFGDAINHLSNNMDATAPEIVEMVRRTGAFAQAAGLAETSTAALSAALLAGGAAPEVAATAMQNMITTMTLGAAATDRQREVFEALGFDAEEMAERMQVDAQGAIYDVMAAMAEMPEHLQISSLTQLFGRESADAIAPLLANLGLLEQAFGLVEDPAAYAGSMLAEYQVQAANTANQLRITTNFIRQMAVSIGTILLPELNNLLATIQPVLTLITDWAAAHPELITLIARVTLGLLAFRAASLALRWGVLSLLTPVLHLIRGGSWMIAMLPRLAAGLLALLNPLAWVRGAMWALRVAFMASGIGLLLAGIAMAGLWIYNNWSGLKQFFIGLWEGFREALGPAGPALDWVIERVQVLWQWLSDLLGPIDATESEWRGWGVAVGEAIGGAIAAVAEWLSTSDGLLSGIGKLLAGWIALRVIWALPMAPIRLIGRLLAWVARGPVMWVVRNIGLIGSTLLWLGRLALANPIGLAIAAVAALAYVVYQNWDELVAWFQEKVEVVRAAFDEGLLQGVFALLAEFNPFTLAMEGLRGLISYVGELLGVPDEVMAQFLGFNPFTSAFEGLQNLIARIMELMGVPDRIIEAFTEFSLWETGVRIMQTLWDGMGSLLGPMVDRIAGALSAIVPFWMIDAWNWVSGNDEDSQARQELLDNLDSLPTDQGDAVRILNEALSDLPAEADRANLERQAQILRDQIATGERLGETRGLTDDPEHMAQLADLREELAGVEADMAAMDARTAELQAALQVLSETEVAPEVNRESIERALTAAAALNRNLRELPDVPPSPLNDPGLEGARDAGGPVRAGLPYLVGERGREIFIPGQSGSILPARALRMAMAASALAAPVAAMPAPEAMVDRIDRRPPLSATITQRSETRIEVGQIVVQAAPGQDPAEIARAVRRELERLQDERRGDLHDGVDF